MLCTHVLSITIWGIIHIRSGGQLDSAPWARIWGSDCYCDVLLWRSESQQWSTTWTVARWQRWGLGLLTWSHVCSGNMQVSHLQEHLQHSQFPHSPNLVHCIFFFCFPKLIFCLWVVGADLNFRSLVKLQNKLIPVVTKMCAEISGADKQPNTCSQKLLIAPPTCTLL